MYDGSDFTREFFKKVKDPAAWIYPLDVEKLEETADVSLFGVKVITDRRIPPGTFYLVDMDKLPPPFGSGA